MRGSRGRQGGGQCPNPSQSCRPRSHRGKSRVRTLSKAGRLCFPSASQRLASAWPGGSPEVGGNSFSEHPSQVPALLKSPIHSCPLIPGSFPQKHPLILVSGTFLYRHTPCLETYMQMHTLLLYTPFYTMFPLIYTLQRFFHIRTW